MASQPSAAFNGSLLDNLRPINYDARLCSKRTAPCKTSDLEDTRILAKGPNREINFEREHGLSNLSDNAAGFNRIDEQ